MKSVAILAQKPAMLTLRRALELEAPSLALERRRTCTWRSGKLWGADLDGELSQESITQAGRR